MAIDRARLLAIFAEELEDRRRDLERGLLALEDDPTHEERTELVAQLFRAAHSLKGAAHSAGVAPIAETAHGLEELFAQLRSSEQAPDGEQLRAALEVVDELDEQARRLRGDASAAAEANGEPADHRTPAPVHRRRGDSTEPLRARVTSEHLNAAMAAAGELHLEVAAVTELSGAMTRLAADVHRLEREWHELRTSLDSEAHAVTATAAADLGGHMQQLATSVIDVERRAGERKHRLGLAADQVMHAVQRLGLVRFDDVCVGLDRVVRDVAAPAGKLALLEVDEGTLELDRTVAAVLRDPLVHLVRNAVDHGLEEPAVRTHAGKLTQGQVSVGAALDAGELVVTVADDGAGVDTAAIREMANRRGLEVPASDDELLQLLFTPGFSTRTTTTDVSGRGVGLDVVRSSVEAVGGSVDIRNGADAGVVVRMRLPQTVSTMRAIVVRVAGEVVALPASGVDAVRRLPPGSMTTTDGQRMALLDDRSIPLADLGEVLGFGPTGSPDAAALVVVLRTADGAAAVVVDEAVAEQEFWVRPLPDRLRELRGVLGGAVLGDGRCALLLSPATWVRSVRQHDHPSRHPAPHPSAAERARILLAEDTATTRMLEQSILEAAGYDVLVAADGQAAWQLLQQGDVDLVVTDVDMPGMDGFELCSAIRSSPQLSHLPVVLVTSLADDRHRTRGMEVGADAYFVKSGFDQTSVLDTIARLL